MPHEASTIYVSNVADTEPLYRYRKGGYHPTLIGDTFKNGRYRALRRFGHGGYSTVWLVTDTK